MKKLWDNIDIQKNSKFLFKSLRKRSIRDLFFQHSDYKDGENYELYENLENISKKKSRDRKYGHLHN